MLEMYMQVMVYVQEQTLDMSICSVTLQKWQQQQVQELMEAIISVQDRLVKARTMLRDFK